MRLIKSLDISRPRLRHLASAADGISEQKPSQRLQMPTAEDELRARAETLNAMLARLGAAITRITRFTAGASHELGTLVTTICTAAEKILE